MRVFISYRREDTSGQAGRLYDALAKQLGPDNVFMDVDTIDIGVEFKDAIESAVTSCDVLFAMIGPRWLTVADSRGERRLSRADDYVRLEIEAALARNIRVVPALIAGASMPGSDDLPGTLAPLARRNALEMADGPRWQYDVSRLMNLLERIRAGESHPELAPPLESEALAITRAEALAETEAAADPQETSQPHAAATHQHAESPVHEGAASVSHPPPSSTAGAPQPSAGVGGVGSTQPPGGTGGGAGGGGGGGGGGSWQGGQGPGGHGPGGHRSGGLSDAPRWLVALAGLGIVALLAVALLGAYQLGGGGSADSSSTVPSIPGITADTTTAPTTAPTTGATTATTDSTAPPANADADQKALWLSIPKTIRRGACKLANTEHAGGVATINCDYNDPKHGRTLIHLDRYIDANHLQPTYKLHGPGEVAARGGSPDPKLKAATGGCTRTRWRGEGPWSHETSGGVMGPVSGRYACYQAEGQCDLVKKMKLTDVNGSTCFVIVWTDDLANMFVKAEQQSGVHAGLSSFFDFWHHQFG